MTLANVLAQVAPGGPAAPTEPSSAELWVFLVVGAVALGSAVSVVVLRNAVHAALMLVVNFFMIAVLYALLEAQFLATVQIIVYAGAIMVLFLFVIMLLGVDRDTDPTRGDHLKGQRAAAVLFGLALFAALAIGVAGPYLSPDSACPTPPTATAEHPCAGLAQANAGGNVEGVGALLFTRFVWPFEVTSVLLVIASIGAMVLGRKDEDPGDLVDRLDEPTVAAGAPPPADDEPPVPLETGAGAAGHEGDR